MKRQRLRRVTACLGLLLATPLLASAAEEAPGWEATFSLGATATRGNSDTVLLNTKIEAERSGDANEFSLDAEGNYGQTEVEKDDGSTETETNAQNARGAAKYRRVFWKRNYVYLSTEAIHDDVAEIDYRFVLGPGLGRYLWQSDKGRLGFDLGPSYILERSDGRDDSRLTLRVSERFRFKLSDTARIWQKAELLPAVEDFGDYLLSVEVGLEARITDRVSLRFVVQDRYDSDPPADTEENDLTVITGLGIQLF